MPRIYNQYHVRKDIHKIVYKTMKKFDNVKVVVMNHAYRLNGVVDLYRSMRTFWDIENDEYIKIDDEKEAVFKAFQMASERTPRQPFKKTDKGNMTWQEFKHRQ